MAHRSQVAVDGLDANAEVLLAQLGGEDGGPHLQLERRDAADHHRLRLPEQQRLICRRLPHHTAVFVQQHGLCGGTQRGVSVGARGVMSVLNDAV